VSTVNFTVQQFPFHFSDTTSEKNLAQVCVRLLGLDNINDLVTACVNPDKVDSALRNGNREQRLDALYKLRFAFRTKELERVAPLLEKARWLATQSRAYSRLSNRHKGALATKVTPTNLYKLQAGIIQALEAHTALVAQMGQPTPQGVPQNVDRKKERRDRDRETRRRMRGDSVGHGKQRAA
jgi:hypothetical protein